MGKVIGSLCAYAAMFAVILAVIAISLITIGFLCWLAFFIWAHVFTFFV